MGKELLTEFELEEYAYVDQLDWEYIDRTAVEVARLARLAAPVEIAYQPGDGTFYGIVLMPLWHGLTGTPSRRPDPNEPSWSTRAIRGIPSGEYGYPQGWFLLSLVGYAAAPVELPTIHTVHYVEDQWCSRMGRASSYALLVLLRAISREIEKEGL